MPEEKKYNAGVTREAAEAAIVVVMRENPTLANTEKNGNLIAEWLKSMKCEFTLKNIRLAVQALSYPDDKFERVKSAPEPAPAKSKKEFTPPGQLPLKCSKAQLARASEAQIKDWLKRARQAGMK